VSELFRARVPDLATTDSASMIINSFPDMCIDTYMSDRPYVPPPDVKSVIRIVCIAW